MNQYLSTVYDEALKRGFNFDEKKFIKPIIPLFITVSDGQIKYEFGHLLKKLKKRANNLYNKLKGTKNILPNPMFEIVKGKIEKWEIVK